MKTLSGTLYIHVGSEPIKTRRTRLLDITYVCEENRRNLGLLQVK